jgi:hypothetical protein
MVVPESMEYGHHERSLVSFSTYILEVHSLIRGLEATLNDMTIILSPWVNARKVP